MVAVLTNLGLGLANASSRLLGLRGLVGDATQGRGGEQVHVNAATGNLIIQHRDDMLIGRGPNLTVSRTYNSLGAFTDDNGDNWRVDASRLVAGLTGTVNTAGSTISYTDGDGSVTVYAYDSVLGKYLSKEGEGAYDTITWNAGAATWTRRDGASGLAETFDSAHGGRLTKIADLSGNEISYAYDSNGYLSQATTANGEITYYDYNSSGQLTQVRTSDGTNTLTRVGYGYDSSSRLSTVTTDLTPGDNSVSDGAVYVTTYAYDGSSKRVAQINQSDGSRLDISYDGAGRVSGLVQTVATGVTRATSFAYSANSTTITDALGQVTTLAYDSAGQLTQVTAPAVNGVSQVQSFTYNSNGDVTKITDASGRETVFTYDGAGNLTLSRDPAGATVTRTYSASNQILTETIHLGLDPDGDGSGAASAPQTTRYVYDANDNLRFKISPEGRVAEYRYDGFGQQDTVIAYTGNAYDVSGLGATASIALSAMTTWVSGISDKSGTTRTDIVHDARGAVSSVTTYGKVNSDGTGYTAAETSKTVYIYDTYGNLLERRPTDGSSAADVYVYDGMGRRISTTDLNGATTSVNFDDANGKTIVTLANGLVKTSQYSRAGELLSATDFNGATALASVHYVYDAVGRLRIVEDATGKKSHVLYDAVGRKVADIAPDGALTEYVYDARNLLIATIVYKTLVSAGDLASLVDGSGNPSAEDLDDIRPATDAGDRWSWRIYDNSGQLAQTIDASGAVAAFGYDGAGRQISARAYANALSETTLAGFKTSPPLAAQSVTTDGADRVGRSFYSADGLLIGTLDGEGYFTEIKYDQAGRKSETIAYAGATTSGLRAAGSFADLRASVTEPAVTSAVAAADVHSYCLYDGRGLLRAEVSGEGDVTVYRYNQYGDVDQVTRGAKLAANTAPTLANVAAAISAAARTEVIGYTRTVYGDILSQTLTLAGGTETSTFAYDVLRQRVSESLADAGGARGVLRRFDLQGRLIGELRGEGAAALLALGGSPTQTQIDNVYNTYGVQYVYDSAGRLISKRTPNGVDAAGYKTFYFYDVDGRLRFEINPLGEVVEYRYSVFGEQTDRVAYGTRLTSGALSGMTGGFLGAGLESAIAAIADITKDSRTQRAFDGRGLASSATDAAGKTTTYSYNAFAEEVSRIKPFNGAAVVQANRTYDRRGLLVSAVEDVGGLALTELRAYDAFGRVSATTDARGIVRNSKYDRAGRTIEIADGLGHNETMSYDAFGNVLTRTDRNGAATAYAYDAFNRTITTTTAEGVVASVKTNAFGQTITITDGAGAITAYEYNRDGAITAVKRGPVGAQTVLANAYDEAGRLEEITDERGIKTAFAYDSANRVLTKTVDPAGLALATSYAYDSKGQTVLTTDPSGVATKVDYDLAGRRTTVTIDPGSGKLNLVTTFAYNDAGDVVTVSEGAGGAVRVTQNQYDKAGRLIATAIDPAGLNIITQYAYDADGNVVAVTDALNGVKRLAYDNENRLIYTVDAAGGVTKSQYDFGGNIVERIAYAARISLTGLAVAASESAIASRISSSSADNRTRFVYDQDGRLRFTIDALGYVTARTYDGASNVLSEIAHASAITLPASPNVTNVAAAITSAAADRLTRTVFDALNRAAFQIDAEGAVTTNTYDNAGNLIKQVKFETVYTNSGPPVLSAMQALSAANPATGDRTTRYLYDAGGRLAYTVDAESHVDERQYDETGRLTRSIRYAAQYSVSDGATTASVKAALPATPPTSARVQDYRYDHAGRLYESVDGEGFVTRLTLDALGRITDETRAFGVADAAVTHRIYDAASRLKEEHKAYGAAEVSVTKYAYDALGRVTTVTNARNFDTVRTYDAVGNLLTETVPLSASANAVTTKQYDAFGNVIKITDPRGNSGFFYYDQLSRLTVQVDPEGYATQTAYTMSGQTASVKRYATKVAGTLVVGTPPTLSSSATDALTGFEYDELDRLTKTTDAEGAFETYTYDAFGGQVSKTNKLGGVTNQAFYKNGLLKTETMVGVTVRGAAANVANAYEYDARGNLTKLIEGSGSVDARTTQFTYDKLDRRLSKAGDAVTVVATSVSGTTLTTAASSTSPTETIKYDARGNVIETIDAAGARTLYFYDHQDRKIAELRQVGALSASVGALTEFTLDEAGNVTAKKAYANTLALPTLAGGARPTQTGGSRETSYVYDRNNRLVETQNAGVDIGQMLSVANGEPQYGLSLAQTIVSRTGYDAAGNVVQRIDGAQLVSGALVGGASTFSFYDKLGRKTAELDQSRYLTVYEFDENGNITAQKRYFNAIGSGNPVSETAPVGVLIAWAGTHSDDRITTFTYDKNGRKLTEARANVEATSIATNGVATTVSGASRVTATTAFTYNALGQVLTRTEANGDAATHAYDVFGRETSFQKSAYVDYSGATVTPKTDTEYDALGQTLRSIVRGTNGASESDDRITAYAYSFGRLATVTDAAGFVKNYAYDAAGRVVGEHYTRQKANGSSVTEGNFVRYDAAGQQIWRAAGAATGANSWALSDRTEMFYSAYGDMIARGVNVAGNLANAQEFADYDSLGRVWRTNMGDGVTKAYAYDGRGNATLLVTSQGAVNLKQAANINAIWNDQTAGLMKTVSVYDARNLLTETFQPKVSGNGTSVMSAQPVNGIDHGYNYFSSTSAAPAPDTVTNVWGAVPSSAATHTASPVAMLNVNRWVDWMDCGYWTGGGEYYGEYVSRWYPIDMVDISGINALARYGSGQVLVWNDTTGEYFYQPYGYDIVYYLRDYGNWHFYQELPNSAGWAYLGNTSDSWHTAELIIQNANPAITRMIMYARVYGSNQPFTVVESTPVYNSWGSLVPGSYKFHLHGAPFSNLESPSTYWEIQYVGYNSSGSYSATGNIVESTAGFIATDGASYVYNCFSYADTWRAPVGGPGYARLLGGTAGGYLHISGLPSNPASVRLRYRVVGSGAAWSSTTMTPNAWNISGAWIASGFTSGTNYEFWVEPLDGSGNLIANKRSYGTLTGGQTVQWQQQSSGNTLKQFTDNAESVTFTVPAGINPAPTSIRIRYKTGAGSWSAWTNLTASGSNWIWNTASLVTDDFATALYNVEFEAYNGTTKVYDSAGNVTLGYANPNATAPTYTLASDGVPARVEFKPAHASTNKIKVFYRDVAIGGAYTQIEVTKDAVSNRFLWDVDAAGARPATGSKTFEYYYDSYNASDVLLPTLNGEDHARGVLTIESNRYSDSQNSEIRWVLNTSAGSDYLIRRSQSYNAFGEIVSETDGNGYVTDFRYSTIGKLIEKKAPETDVVSEAGATTRARPTETYLYDIAGRLVGMRDANNNLSAQLLLAGSGHDGENAIIVKQFNADSTAKSFGADVFGDVRKITNEAGGVTENAYDGLGRLVSVAHEQRGDGTRLTDNYAYDQLGQRIKRWNSQLGSGVTETTDYDVEGRVSATTTMAGRATNYDYAFFSPTSSALSGHADFIGWRKITSAGGLQYTDYSDLFGRLIYKTDLGGHGFAYSYDRAGHIISQRGDTALGASNSGQSIDFTYHINGYVKSITDNALQMVSTFAYDNQGARISETYNSAPGAYNAVYYQNAVITYDELGRIKRFLDAKADITYAYDSSGNRRRVHSKYFDGLSSGAIADQDYWYRYDSMNRFVLTKGALASGAIVKGGEGVEIGYDARGNRAQAVYGHDGHRENYTYTADGYLADTTINDVLAARRVSDALGRVTEYVEYQSDGSTVQSSRSAIAYDGDNRVTDETRQARLANGSYQTSGVHSDYKFDVGGESFTGADAGVLTHTRETIGAVTIDTRYTYQYWDEAKQQQIEVRGNNPNNPNSWAWQAGYSDLTYDANGHLVRAQTHDALPRTLTYQNDSYGQVMIREEKVAGVLGPRQNYYYFDGHRIGDVGNNGPSREDYAQALASAASAPAQRTSAFRFGRPIASADFDQNYEPISAGYPGAASQSYTHRIPRNAA